MRVKKADETDNQDNLAVATLLQRKGEAHLYKREFIRAKANFDSAMQINKKISGDDSIGTASSTYCLGVVHYYLGDCSHARLLFLECLRIQLKNSGESNSSPARTLCWIGKQHEKLNEPEKALERYLSALQVYKRERSGIDYRVVAMILHSTGGLYETNTVDSPEMALKCKS